MHNSTFYRNIPFTFSSIKLLAFAYFISISSLVFENDKWTFGGCFGHFNLSHILKANRPMAKLEPRQIYYWPNDLKFKRIFYGFKNILPQDALQHTGQVILQSIHTFSTYILYRSNVSHHVLSKILITTCNRIWSILTQLLFLSI